MQLAIIVCFENVSWQRKLVTLGSSVTLAPLRGRKREADSSAENACPREGELADARYAGGKVGLTFTSLTSLGKNIRIKIQHDIRFSQP